MSSQNPDIPKRIGEYEVVGLLGSGRYGTVYRIKDPLSASDKALKLFTQKIQHSIISVRRFEREFHSISKLDHPHIIKMFDKGAHDGQLYFTMELVDGTTLNRYIDPVKKPREMTNLLNQDRMNRIFSCINQTLTALQYLHDNRIVHRDLKPENIMVNNLDQVKLMDFGLIKQFDAKSVLTMQGSIVGTLTHIAPEQIRGVEIDGRADLYAVGIILYHLVTGSLPFTADDVPQLLFKHLHDLPESPELKNPRIGKRLAGIIEQALNKEPVFRFQSAAEFNCALQECWK